MCASCCWCPWIRVFDEAVEFAVLKATLVFLVSKVIALVNTAYVAGWPC